MTHFTMAACPHPILRLFPSQLRTHPLPCPVPVECDFPTAMGSRLSSAPWRSPHRLAHRWASGVGARPLGSCFSLAVALEEVSLPTQAADLCHVPSSPGVHCDHRWRWLPDAALRRGGDGAAPSPWGPLPWRGYVSEALSPAPSVEYLVAPGPAAQSPVSVWASCLCSGLYCPSFLAQLTLHGCHSYSVGFACLQGTYPWVSYT